MAEKDYTFKVAIGRSEVIKIIVDGSSRAPVSDYGDSEDPSKSSQEDYIATDDNVPNKKEQKWFFFDLGTRLRNVTVPSTFSDTRAIDDHSAIPLVVEGHTLEYVEIQFDAPATLQQGFGGTGGERVDVTPDDLDTVASWDSRLLGIGDIVSPFRTTRLLHGMARDIPNCMPLKYSGSVFDIPASQINAILYNPTEVVQAPRTFTNYPALTHRWKNADDPTTERKEWETWNELSDSQRSFNGSSVVVVPLVARGYMDVKPHPGEPVNQKLKSGSLQVRFSSRTAYEPFDTGDRVNYKVTREPTFDATEVGFSVHNTDPLKFFLKPQWLGAYALLGLSGQANAHYEPAENWSGLSFPSADGQPGGPLLGGLQGASVSRVLGAGDANLLPLGSGGYGSITVNTFSGAWSISTPFGSFSGTATAYATPVFGGVIYGYADHIFSGPLEILVGFNNANPATGGPFASAYYSGDVTASSTGPWIGMGYGSTVNKFIGFTGSGLIGAHICRRPVFPFITQSTFSGTVNGTRETPSFQLDNTLTPVYNRHPSRGLNSSITDLTESSAVIPVPFGLPDITVFPNSPSIGPTGSLADLNALIQSNVDSSLALLDATISSTAMRNLITSSVGGASHVGSYYMVQLTAEVGSLCGVIQKGSTKYYVWRKTQDVRSGLTDHYARNSISLSASGLTEG